MPSSVRALAASVALPLVGCASVAVPDGPPASAPRVVATAVLEAPAAIGAADGVAFVEGGLSGLDRLPDGRFVAVSDRGPNAEAGARAGRAAKRFPFPAYAPSLVTLRADGGRLVEVARVPLAGPAGEPASGLPPPDAHAASLVEVALADTLGAALAPDPWGLDAEGVAAAPDGSFWVAEEYRPSLWHVGPDGRLLARYTPRPVGPRDRPLPAALLARRPNYGFEGVARLPDGRVVAAMQGPLGEAPTAVVRLVVLAPATGRAHTVAFAMDGPERKVGDVAALPDGSVLVVEHGPVPGRAAWSAHVYHLDLAAATPVPDGATPVPDGATPVPDGATPEAGAATGLAPKTLVADLLAAGWPPAHQKPEGLTVVDATTVALVNDNDYGLATPRGDGVFVPTGMPTVLTWIRLPQPLPGFGRVRPAVSR